MVDSASTSRQLGVLTGASAPDLTEDGQAVRRRLEARGVEVDPVLWTDESIDWSAYGAVLVRSCWEYHTDPDRFRTLLGELSIADVAVFNPLAGIRWNTHKSYLQELAVDGIDLPSTVVFDAGSAVPLDSVLQRQGWDRAVVKPAIGASSTGVWQTSQAETAAHSQRFQSALHQRDLVVQEFLPEIRSGERSIVFICGNDSHTWNDLPEPDDFSAFGETDLSYEPSEPIRNAARTVVETAAKRIGCAPSELLYARVDYIERDDTLVLLELELIEPFLGLRRSEGGLDRFVSALVERL